MSALNWSFGLAAAAAALAAWWGPHDDVAPARRASSAPGIAAAPRLELEPRARTLSARRHDLFDTPSAAVRPSRPALKVAQPPQAPPLPYKYDGSGEWQGKRFLFLAREGRSLMVSRGDTIDGAYRVESVARDHAVLSYLPLGTRQVLMYTASEAPPELAVAVSPARPVELQVDVPAEVVLGQEFVVTVALPGAGPLKATVEVGYDAEVLSMVGAGLPRSGGRAVVEVPGGSAPHTQLRFKVLADTPASTDIALQVNATDASGKRVPVQVPTAYTVSLVQPGA